MKIQETVIHMDDNFNEVPEENSTQWKVMAHDEDNHLVYEMFGYVPPNFSPANAPPPLENSLKISVTPKTKKVYRPR